MSFLELFLLGPPRVEQAGSPVSIKRRKALALLAYLAVTANRHSREALATLLWPDYDAERAFAYLRNALWVLNQTPVGDWLEVDNETASVKQANLSLDVARFRECLAACQAHPHPESQICADCIPLLSEAVDLYQEDFMAGFGLDDSAAFDDWQFFEAETLRRELAGTLKKLTHFFAAQKNFESAILYARRWSALDSLSEPAQRHLMSLYAQSGQRTAALRQYETLSATLQKELNLAPSPESVELYQQIRSGKLGAASETTELPLPLHNLPPQPTPFVGREAELIEIQRLLEQPECRLLSIVGLGGSGKTRLALEAAGQWVGSFSGGVFFIPLAPLSGPEFVAPAIADALQAPLLQRDSDLVQTPSGGLEAMQAQLVDYLRSKSMLLVLDNVEHLITLSAPEVSSVQVVPSGGVEQLVKEILQAAPGVKMLLTSRERLNLRDEWVLEITGLQFPPPDTPLDTVESYAAARLFLQSARRAQVGFSTTAADRAAVARICRLVEGVPLGIELAAPWVKVLSCSEIAAEIQANLDFLTSSLRDMPQRHRSLRAIFEQSWALLSGDGRACFRKLAVFHGGFTREAARDVAGASLPALASLVDKSLLRRTSHERYEMHELLRQYAEERLGAVPRESDLVRDRHCKHYLALLQQSEQALKSAGQPKALETLRWEVENVRTAWRWAAAREKWSALHGAAMSLFLFYDIRSRFQEGAEMFRAAAISLEANPQPRFSPEDADKQALLALLLAIRGWFVRFFSRAEAQSLFERAAAHLEPLGPRKESAFIKVLRAFAGLWSSPLEAEERLRESLAFFETQNDLWGTAVTLDAMSHTAFEANKDRARRCAKQSLALRRQLGDQWGMAMSHGTLGRIAEHSGEFETAQEQYRVSLELRQELGEDLAGVVNCLNGIGRVAQRRGNYEQAQQRFQQSLAIAKQIGNRWHIAQSMADLGRVAYNLEDYEKAHDHFEKALVLLQEISTPRQIAYVLQGLGNVALARGDREAARHHFEQSRKTQPDNPGAFVGLGHLYTALGDHVEAEELYRQALHHTRAWQADEAALQALVGLARLRLAENAPQEGLELLGLVIDHPARSHKIQIQTRELVEQTQQMLPSDQAQAALERGRAQELETLIDQLGRTRKVDARGCNGAAELSEPKAPGS